MAAIRLIRVSRLRPLSVLGAPTMRNVPVTVRLSVTCISAGFSSESGQVNGEVEKKPLMAAALVNGVGPLRTQTSERIGLATLRKIVTRPRPWSLIIQSLVEKIIMDSRFFTMLGVVGTLLGSVLCFLEGVFLVVESYLHYFQAIYHHSDHAHIMHLLIEALDMFLVGTAMLTFGMALHVMFIGSRAAKGNGSLIPPSNFFGLFYLKEMPSWAGMKSIAQAKSKIGHALMLLLQVGVLEKFKSIPLVTGLDLACFAAAIFVSSAGLFILSQISAGMKP
ncbi:hypothetical protein HanXRQr2_Chr16g0735911 [Helianthus annuus]|uniref:Uncharacterized protein n=1 Tax=Helianthus annuus TaxID=4232 RepID=A0A251RXJ8_HELAN|nr:uncharacterized protein LOC110916634 [Helianthus annuus]KAF5758998.1 hypothetical protein HanXRQr2_Chr16g0735911 [Helianthus annuus]